MKYLWIISCFMAMSMISSCNGRERRDKPEKITDDPLKQQETENDTTLQPIEEITIRAVGGDDTAAVTFDQDTLEVKAGSLVRLELINEGHDPKMIHNIVFTKRSNYKLAAQQGAKAGASGNYLPDSAIMIAASPLALPGQTVKMEFKAPDKPGTFDFVSTYPGDSEKLKGILIVK